MNEMNQNPSKNFLVNLIDAISESIENNPDDLREALADEGLNYNDLAKEGLDFVKQLSREQRFASANERKERVLRLIQDFKSGHFIGKRPDLIVAFKELFSEGKAAAAFYHKLETFSDSDLKDMLNEAEVLKLLEKEIKDSGG
jgi:hypothetical protein